MIYRAHNPKNLSFTFITQKSLKRDNVCKFCLWLLEEHNLPSINTLACSKARYRACA